jgi:hypothetical protein
LFEELEKIGLAEDVFGTSLINLAFHNRREIVDYLVSKLRGWGPNSIAADFLKQLARTRNSPRLAQGLHDSWRVEQISAVVQEIFTPGDLNTGGDDDAGVPVRKPRGPESGGRAAAQNPNDDSPSDRH